MTASARYGSVVIALCLLCACERPPSRPASSSRQPPILETLRAEHPRLLLHPGDFERLAARIEKNPVLDDWARRVRAQADEYLRLAPQKYELPDGVRLIDASNRVLERVLALAVTYRLTHEKRYIERLWNELAEAAAYPNWNPPHFIDTAEMTHAFAIAYDWLYADWSVSQREMIAKAIRRLGLEPGLEAYRSSGKAGWWTKATHNWNQICNGGLVMGALAIADEQPVLAAEIIRYARESAPRALTAYEPDGAPVEGPSYWAHGTRYSVLMFASLESALGTDFGLSSSPGFIETAFYPVYMTGPSGTMFAFADTDPAKRPVSMPLWWLARKAHSPLVANFAREIAVPLPYDLVMADPSDTPPDLSSLPLAKYWRGLEAVTMRSAWNAPDATFVGFKAGSNAVNHAHLDAGTFVLEALGETWAVDLGSDSYALEGYFGKERWQYYRTRTEGQNTLLIAPGASPGQSLKARTTITQFSASPGHSFAIADLSDAYPDMTAVRRGIALAGRDVWIEDELEANKMVRAVWAMHTKASISIDPKSPRTALLTQNGKHVVVQLVAPADAAFTVMKAEPMSSSPHPSAQNENNGITKLAIDLTATKTTTLVVAICITDENCAQKAAVTSLSSW